MYKMKKFLSIIIVSIFLVSSITALNAMARVPNGETYVEYHLDKPVVKQTEIEGIVYDYLELKDAPSFGDPGEPNLPIKSANILLPYGTCVEEIIVTPGEKISLGSNYNILPVSEPIPISMIKAVKAPSPDMTIYNSDDLFPGKFYDEIGVYIFRGYQILVLSLYPIQYKPESGEIFYYPNLNVDVNTITEDNIANSYLGRHSDSLDVVNKVDNPDIVDTYPLLNYDFTGHYDLMILTTTELKNAFQPLKQANDARGVSTQIKTLSDIKINPNSVTPEDIRDFIRTEYQSNGIQYVLFGGDKDVVPAKMLYVSGYDEDQQNRFYEDEMPSDLYFACLDGTYNYDGDEIWGEATDGDNGEDVDLMAEVFVGRACVDNAEDVNNFVEKTIDYLNTDYGDAYLGKVLMAGEELGPYGVAQWGGNYLDLQVDECDDSGYTTQGIPSDRYDIEYMYDRDWDNNYWMAQELVDVVNDNVLIINHDGHSSYQYNMKMSIDGVEAFENVKPFFAYSSGCMCGGFDQPNDDDCFAEYLTVKSPNAAFAAIMNARYGWFWAYSLDGDGVRFKRQFWDAIFDENIPVISKANQESKEDNLYILGRSCIRWTYYQLNYFGDPSVAFKLSMPPNKPEKPTGETSPEPNQAYQYSSSTSEPDGEQLYYMWDWGDGTLSEWDGPYNSGETVQASHSWSEKGTYDVRIKARDSHGVESEWSDPLSITMPKIKNSLRFRDIIRDILNYLRNNRLLT